MTQRAEGRALLQTTVTVQEAALIRERAALAGRSIASEIRVALRDYFATPPRPYLGNSEAARESGFTTRMTVRDAPR